MAGDIHGKPPGQTLAWGKHNAPHGALTHMLRNLHHPEGALDLNGELLPQLWQLTFGDLHIYNRAGDLHNNSSFQTPVTPSFAAAPWPRRIPQ